MRLREKRDGESKTSGEKQPSSSPSSHPSTQISSPFNKPNYQISFASDSKSIEQAPPEQIVNGNPSESADDEIIAGYRLIIIITYSTQKF